MASLKERWGGSNLSMISTFGKGDCEVMAAELFELHVRLGSCLNKYLLFKNIPSVFVIALTPFTR